MAEAHSAVAFSFSVTSEGLDVNVNREVLGLIFKSGVTSWKKRLGRFKNTFRTGIYPVTPMGLGFIVTLIASMKAKNFAPRITYLDNIVDTMPKVDIYDNTVNIFGNVFYGVVVCGAFTFTIRMMLRVLFTYQRWIYEVRGPVSLRTKIWLMFVKAFRFIGQEPLLTSFQGALPKLPVPSIEDTMTRYLRSVKPLLDEENYDRMEKLALDFKNGVAKKLQRYLILKSWWASNYVSDWWEEYVYLRGRSPIMVNSNFYGVDAVLIQHTPIQVARAANLIYAMLLYRRTLERQELKPIFVNKIIPLCSSQYERQFNTTRIPGIETDTLVHYKDSNHIAVYHKGRFYKVYIRHGGRLLTPKEIEVSLQKIVSDRTEPCPGEMHLAALTACDRVSWAKARQNFFSKGKNKTSLDAIEKAAFFVTLDDEPQSYSDLDPTKLNKFSRSMLHGKGYDRWFDKSFTLVVCSNGTVGFNAEHSWADAPVTGHLWEFTLSEDILNLRYTDDGHTKGTIIEPLPNPIKLEWDISTECQDVIQTSLKVATELLNNVDLYILIHNQYGKRLMKQHKISPDAYIQMALQLAYYRDCKKFSLTYESAMTRLFREGRTETVRSCTLESVEFVKAINDPSVPRKKCRELLMKACNVHQKSYREAMTGNGIDRHLFCLYVVSKYLKIDSPFLKEVLSEPWRLSTSQTPHQQTDKFDLNKNPEYISAGGGFGPVADDGYGVSYIIAGEDVVFFHISSIKSSPTTDSERFSKNILNSMQDIKQMLESS
ncbi:carnitine O-palmitoyltransferase 1, liver isoform isoform X2 [Octopus sinensis]|uniref:carnitine O-palmitoyltransferase n=1 Tax=Octopus sinensis TaxID=2607531 RepID=A0A6P7U675_9MOLL|nr:carnitine O-palmitoyltransferase 1, liver isoform isoform X2 [Octopus sinensis]